MEQMIGAIVLMLFVVLESESRLKNSNANSKVY